MNHHTPLRIAVIGGGAAGLATAWLLSHGRIGHQGQIFGAVTRQPHHVTLFEKDDRLGGHANTAQVKSGTDSQSRDNEVSIDTGFIVYNALNYPNFTAWLDQLGVESQPSEMSFSVSRDGGRFEYKGGDTLGLFAQPTNILRPRFWRMLTDLVRFYRAASDNPLPPPDVTLRQVLSDGGYGVEFIEDHLLPFGAAIWSTSQNNMLDYPAAAFIRFCQNHGLLQLSGRPQWRTITGGSHQYVARVRQDLKDHTVCTSSKVVRVIRQPGGVIVENRDGIQQHFDHVVLATHADQALDLLHDASELESELLSRFTYDQNLAILHTDTSLLPKRRRAWASWNYLDSSTGAHEDKVSVSYWMNCLQSLQCERNYIVSLNPAWSPATHSILRTSVYKHPIFTADTHAAQQQLWSLQGKRNTWFCGAYFGAGFHEDAIQSGLAVAEQLGGIKRPWSVDNESGRIELGANVIHYPDELVA